MRKIARNGPFSVRAIAGSHVVVLAWNVDDKAWLDFSDRWLGVAIQRIEHRSGDDPTIVERYWLRGMKRFEFVDRGAAPGAQFPLSEHPVQGFQWGDYTPKPGVTYTYRLVPVRGQPKLLELADDQAVEVTITTELENDGTHGIWFNRGVAGSQAYARRFGKTRPDADAPESEQMKWLSRGLYEALLEFIGQASGPRFALRGALYELRYGPVVDALRVALGNRADVRVLYDDPNYGDENRSYIEAAGIDGACSPRGGNKSQKHNKFLVLLEDDQPVAVWTGSTNISPGGIFGHSNVGHAIRDPEIAGQYLRYWQVLAADPAAANSALRPQIIAAWPTPAEARPEVGLSTMFSPRSGRTLDWYAELMQTASNIACLTVAFTLADAFAVVLEEDTDTLRYILKDKGGGSSLQLDTEVLIAAGAKLDDDDFPGWLGEQLTGFNRNLWIHDKFMLVDPLGEDPVVATGSANFSVGSMSSNDENVLLIRGDRRVADIYFGEFMRVFDHIYARHMIKRAIEQGRDLSRNYLREDQRWVRAYQGDNPKARRRQYFRGTGEPAGP